MSDLGNWDPMKMDFEDQTFNSYKHGPGKSMQVKKMMK